MRFKINIDKGPASVFIELSEQRKMLKAKQLINIHDSCNYNNSANHPWNYLESEAENEREYFPVENFNNSYTVFSALDGDLFYDLVDLLYESVNAEKKGVNWLTNLEVLALLNLSDSNTLQHLVDTKAIRISEVAKDETMYDRQSIEEYLKTLI